MLLKALGFYEHGNDVGVLHRGQTMRDRDCRAAGGRALGGLLTNKDRVASILNVHHWVSLHYLNT
jgi:hypothetical protein